MTVAVQTPISSYTGNGVTTAFSFGYYVAAAGDLVVMVDGVVKALTTDYTLTGIGSGSGGTCTFVTAPASGADVVLYRDTDLLRETDYQDNGDLLAAILNGDFDRIWLALQEIVNGAKSSARNVRAPVGETINELPDATTRAGKILTFNATTGQPEAVAPTSGDATALAVDLASNAAGDGAAMIGFAANLNYAAGTLGQAVQDRSYSITDQPWNCVSGTDCSAAIQAANDYVASLGGGVLIFPAGTWIVTANITRSANVTWRGVSSLASKISITNGTASVYHTGARGGIEDLYIEGPYTTTVARAAAASTSIGVIDNGATTWMRNVRIKNFKIGIEQRIGYWKEYYKLWCEENGTGMNFNASGSDFSNLLTFFGCTWRANDRNGIGASGTPVNNNVISFYGCDIESNCSESPTTYQQIALGNARGVTWSGGYMEAGSVSPAPDMWNFTNTSKAVIQPMYISGARKAFYASSNAAGDIEITVPYYANGASTITSHAYDFPSCTGITVYDSTVHTATIVLDGTNSQLINKKIAQEEVQSWTPVMSGSSTPGTPTYASQIGRAVRIGNFLHFSVRVSTTGAGGAVGNVRISLPVAHQTISGLISTCAVELTGITPTAGKTYFTGRITSGTNYIEIMEGGNAAGMTQVLWTGVAAASTFIVSGVYPISV